jgi:hypothetical protein
VIPQFWSDILGARDELDSFMPRASPVTVCIGPLALIMPVAAQQRATPAMDSADVVVLTDRSEIVSEPLWTLVRSGSQLLEQAQGRQGKPLLLLIDVPVDLPNWVAPLLNRLHLAGVGLFRFAVPGEPSLDHLDGYRNLGQLPYVVDLTARLSAERLEQAITKRHPIASIAGAPMTAELLVAVREQVGVER